MTDLAPASRGPSRPWPAWPVVLSGVMALLVTLVLGTLGWFVNAFGIGTNCTNKFDCTGACTQCATAHAWVTAGGIEQWLLVMAAAILIGLGVGRIAWRRGVLIAEVAITPLAIGLYALATVLAEHSY